MPYKIVQTIERGKSKLTIIPSFWEDKGNLWWPPKKILDKAMKDDQSKPNKEWKLMNYILKRKNIPTYQQAVTELSIMEQHSDTDIKENDTAVVQPRDTLVLQSENQEVINFERLTNNLTYNKENQGTSNINFNENVINQILVNQKKMSEKIDAMLQIQNIAIENQNKIIQKLAAFSVQVEEISLQVAELKATPTSVTLLKDVNPVYNESISIKPIESESELITLDQILADKAYNLKLKKQFSFICSSSVGGGITCAYKLLDILFTRDFLCLCSWSGGSRANKSKIALKDYKNVLKFFFTMVHSWDSTYTVQDNEHFLKVVTKNALQRKCIKNLRTSTKRCRKNKHNNITKRQKTISLLSLDATQSKEELKEIEGENMQIETENIPLSSDYKK